MYEASPIQGYDVSVTGTQDYVDTANSDLVIITAGIARKPGMSRDDLLATNVKIIADVTQKIVATHQIAPIHRLPDAMLGLVDTPSWLRVPDRV